MSDDVLASPAVAHFALDAWARDLTAQIGDALDYARAVSVLEMHEPALARLEWCAVREVFDDIDDDRALVRRGLVGVALRARVSS